MKLDLDLAEGIFIHLISMIEGNWRDQNFLYLFLLLSIVKVSCDESDSMVLYVLLSKMVRSLKMYSGLDSGASVISQVWK